MNQNFGSIALDQITTQLNNLGAKSLAALQDIVSSKLREAQRQERQQAREKIMEIARGLNMTPEEILNLGSPQNGYVRGVIAPKYRNPANPQQTWSGRGREPQWYKDEVATGTHPDQMLINK